MEVWERWLDFEFIAPLCTVLLFWTVEMKKLLYRVVDMLSHSKLLKGYLCRHSFIHEGGLQARRM